MIAQYEVPTDEIIRLVKSGDTLMAMAKWMNLPHTLIDGTRIKPTYKTATAMVTAVHLGIEQIPMAVMDGDFISAF